VVGLAGLALGLEGGVQSVQKALHLEQTLAGQVLKAHFFKKLADRAPGFFRVPLHGFQRFRSGPWLVFNGLKGRPEILMNVAQGLQKVQHIVGRSLNQVFYFQNLFGRLRQFPVDDG
jgi:hypothetical protein